MSAFGQKQTFVNGSHLGKVQGEVCATERLEVGSKAQAVGDLRYRLLKLTIGAKVDGRLTHESKALSVAAIPIQSFK